MKAVLALVFSALTATATAQAAASTTSSGTATSQTPSAAPSATSGSSSSGSSSATASSASATTTSGGCSEGYTFLQYCCLGTLVVTNGNYQCIGAAIPTTASNFNAIASSFEAGQLKTTTFQTNAAPTNGPGGLIWAGVGGAAAYAAYELI